MNVHLVNDEKFVNLSVKRFEQYYPGKNLFVVGVPKGHSGPLQHVAPHPRVKVLNFNSRNAEKKILEWAGGQEKINLFVHFLIPSKARVALRLQGSGRSVKTYWIFYGFGLYNLLEERGDYEVFDNKKPHSWQSVTLNWLKNAALSLLLRCNMFTVCEEFIQKLDYFCFWNHYDYQLLLRHFETDAKFRFFRYYEAPLQKAKPQALKSKGTVFLNHSASASGNHDSLIRWLRPWVEKGEVNRVIAPLSYGSPQVAAEVCRQGEEELGSTFEPWLDFMPKEEYFSALNEISVAWFGHNRQEGGNNIYFFLASGAKVFLRSRNNLLKYLREKGYIVFELEESLNRQDALAPLPLESRLLNAKLAQQEFSPSRIDEVYKKLIDE